MRPACPHCGGSLAIVSGIETDLAAALIEAANRHRVVPDAILQRCRQQRLVQARHMVFRILRKANYSYPEIAEATGFDQSTVQWGCKYSPRLRRDQPARSVGRG